MPIFLNGCMAWLVNRSLDKANASPERRSQVERNGFLAAAGFITGDSLTGICIPDPAAAITLAGPRQSFTTSKLIPR